LKNVFLRDRTARDINDLVTKVLRDLGHPEPPLNLDEVRELLRLDREYYSSTEDGVLREVAHRLTIAGKQVLARPALLLDAIRKFDLRALFLPDALRGHIKSGQRWSLQNRPTEVGLGLGCFTPLPPEEASLFSCANSVDHI
jgi:hypothetical protein